ncbi:branched-chain amino acid aminotransferase [Streptomyces pseudogriseolus]|uniref:branched-chain amino acid aminotransferase n=1 Tax=Streptomyces pseudogriseolus TaxID=36817 RepID=UPI003FA20568
MSNGAVPAFARRLAHPGIPAPVRRRRLTDLSFGTVFTEHMVTVWYREGKGWYDPTIEPFGSLSLSPAATALHYGQAVFEGLKAYGAPDGKVRLFRASDNARRIQRSAMRLAMPVVPEEIFLASLRELVRVDRDWIPNDPEASLYLRPYLVATEEFLGVRPAREFLFGVIACPVAATFPGGADPLSIWVSQDITRAAPGGTGAAKCAGNYAASMAAQQRAAHAGCDQVVFLDAVERRYVEELGGMNVFFVLDDGTLVTPPLTDTILPGITRDSVIKLARDAGHTVQERQYSLQEWRRDAESGAVRESFACGTAAVITPIGTVRATGWEFTISGGSVGPVTEKLRSALVGIQHGQVDDPYGWTEQVL